MKTSFSRFFGVHLPGRAMMLMAALAALADGALAVGAAPEQGSVVLADFGRRAEHKNETLEEQAFGGRSLEAGPL